MIAVVDYKKGNLLSVERGLRAAGADARITDDAAEIAAADAIVSRAGATSLAEISARHIPALLVPFPYATEDHQTMNARACVEAGAAFFVADADVEGAQFTDYLKTLVEDETARQRMSAAAAAAKTRDAAGLLADVVLKACESKSAQ